MPTKFDFRLQPLLDFRKRVEAEKRREFEACRRAADECVAEIGRLDLRCRHWGDAIAASVSGRPASELRLHDAHLRLLEGAIARERRRLAELESSCAEAQDKLVAASRERRVIERLKERRLCAFVREEARGEELAIDEANARAHERRLRERRQVRRAESAAS